MQVVVGQGVAHLGLDQQTVVDPAAQLFIEAVEASATELLGPEQGGVGVAQQ